MREYKLKNLVYTVKVGVTDKLEPVKLSEDEKNTLLQQAVKNDPFVIELTKNIPKHNILIDAIKDYSDGRFYVYVHYIFENLKILHLFYNDTKYYDKTFIYLPDGKVIKLKHMPEWRFDESIPPMLKIDENKQTIHVRYF